MKNNYKQYACILAILFLNINVLAQQNPIAVGGDASNARGRSII